MQILYKFIKKTTPKSNCTYKGQYLALSPYFERRNGKFLSGASMKGLIMNQMSFTIIYDCGMTPHIALRLKLTFTLTFSKGS